MGKKSRKGRKGKRKSYSRRGKKGTVKRSVGRKVVSVRCPGGRKPKISVYKK